MSDTTITCGSCGARIELTEALAAPLVARLKQKVEAEAKQREAALAARTEGLARQAAELEAARAAVAKSQAEIAQGKAAVAEAERAVEQRVAAAVAEKVRAEAQRIAREQEAKAGAAWEARLREMQATLVEKDRKLADAQRAELDVRKAREKLEEQQREWELVKQREIDAERGRIREAAQRETLEQGRLRDAEKDKVIADLKGRIDELQRKAEQGSQQLQGEVAELDLEATLRARFPRDVVEPVPKGQHGGDCLQRVFGPTGQACGTILWESKRTKSWSDGWLPKLRDDQRAARAELAAISTVVLPKDRGRIENIDGVWVCESGLAMAMAALLRQILIDTAGAKAAGEGRHGKMELIYDYLSGPHFRQRVEAIVESFTTMKEDLDAEKRAITKQWAKREKQIERVIENTAGLYGDLQGIAGRGLPEIAALELEAGGEAAGLLPMETDGEDRRRVAR